MGGMYKGESISNQPNLFPVEIHLFFFDVIALYCDALRPTVSKCHQSRTEKVRVLSMDPLLNCRHDFFIRSEMISFFKFGKPGARFWGPNGLLVCAYLNDHLRLLRCYHVKCRMPALFLPPEFAYQNIPDPDLFLHISSSVASSGHPDLASSSKDVLPRLNSPTQNLT